MSQDELHATIKAYRQICNEYPRQGIGVDPLCSDVGLEDPSTVGHSLMETVTAHANGATELLSTV